MRQFIRRVPFHRSRWEQVQRSFLACCILALCFVPAVGRAQAPQAPQVLAARVGNGFVTISWYDPSTANEYTLQRSNNGGGWQTISSGFMTYSMQDGTHTYTSYSDGSVSNGTTYSYRVAVDYYSGSSRTALSGWSNVVSATPNISACSAGVVGEYYYDTYFSSFAFSRNDPSANFGVGTNGSPGGGLGNGSGWSTRWSGYLTPPVDGAYTFHTITDDGVRLWVNGELLIDCWQNGQPNDRTSKSVALSGGVSYDIRVDYFENGNGPASSSLRWSGPVGSDQLIDGQFLSAGTGPAPPTALTGSSGNGQVGLSWSGSSGATSYLVYRSASGASNYRLVGSTPYTSYTDTGLINGTTYFYEVYAKNTCGAAVSGQISVTPQTVYSITLSPSAVIGSNSSTGTVNVTGPPPAAGAVVSLTSDNPAVAGVPASVTVPAGTTMQTFPVTTSLVGARSTVTITGSLNGGSQSAPLTVNPFVVAGLTPSSQSVVEGAAATFTVTLNAPAPAGGIAVGLASGNTAAVGVPASVTVPAGGGSATFTATTNLIPATAAVTVTATLNGSSQPATLTVTVPKLATFTVSPSPVLEGSTAIGTLTLDSPAPAGGVAVALRSDQACAAVPASVTVPGGTTRTTFPIPTTVGNAVTVTATLSATLAGQVLQAPLTVTVPTLTGLTVGPPTSVAEGDSSTGTVTLSGPAPAGGLVVALRSDRACAAVPTSVTVPEGSNIASFTVTTSLTGTTTLATISATVNAQTLTATLNVLVPTLRSLSLNPSALAGGASSYGTVTVSGAIPSAGLAVSLSSSSGAATVPASVTIPAGQAFPGGSGSPYARFPISTSLVTAVTTATITATLNGTPQSATLTINPFLVTGLTLSPASVPGGTPSQATVTLNYPAPSGGMVVGLSTSNAAVASLTATTVTVPAGSSSAGFQVNTVAVAADTAVTISTSLNGSSSATLSVLAPVLTGFTLSPSSVTGGPNPTPSIYYATTSTGALTLSSPAQAGGLAVSLASDNAAAVVPATVLVPAGAATATFTVTTSVVPSPVTATIAAKWGAATLTAPLAIGPVPAVKAPTISPASYKFVNATTVTIRDDASSPSSSAKIYYTTDGSTPTTASPVYAAPLPISSTTVVQAIGVLPGFINSPVATATYTLDLPPTVSLTGPAGGASFFAPANITLSALVADPDGGLPGTVVRVDFLATRSGSTVPVTIGTVTQTSPPGGPLPPSQSWNNGLVQIGWSGAPADNYTLTAVATDDAGLQTTSAAVPITVLCGPAALSSLTLDPPALTGGIPTAGTVGLSSPGGSTPAAALPGGQVITLTALDASGNPSALVTVPATVTVPAGQTGATFPITTAPVAVTQSVRIIAAYHGTVQQQTLTLLPAGP